MKHTAMLQKLFWTRKVVKRFLLCCDLKETQDKLRLTHRILIT